MDDFQQLQRQFSAAIRDPAQPLPQGVAKERMAVYQELFFNNVVNFVSSAFPVLKTLYSEDQWQKKLRLFFQSSTMHSPYFLDIAESYLSWQQQQPLLLEDPPFLLELAHYEWIELYLATAHRTSQLSPLAEVKNSQPLVVDELALLLSYQFPVSQISCEFQPTKPASEPCFLLVYRNEEEDVKFMALNRLSASLLQLLIEAPGQCVTELTASLQTLAPQLTNSSIHDGAATLLQQLAKKGVIRAFQAA